MADDARWANPPGRTDIMPSLKAPVQIVDLPHPGTWRFQVSVVGRAAVDFAHPLRMSILSGRQSVRPEKTQS
jgi:hypothetical protein